MLVVFEPGLEPVAHQFDDWPAPTPTYRCTDDVAALISAGRTVAQHFRAVIIIARSEDQFGSILDHLGGGDPSLPTTYTYVPSFRDDGLPRLQDARFFFVVESGLYEDLGLSKPSPWSDPPMPAAASVPSAHVTPAHPVVAQTAAAGPPAQSHRPGSGVLPTARGPDRPDSVELQMMSGRMLYTAPARLETGQIDQAEVRIARGDVLDEFLREGLRGRNPEHIETLPTSARMTVEMTTSAPDKLQVIPLSVRTQWVTRTVLATWEFDLRAEGPGRHILRLSVRSEIEIDGHASVHAPPVIERVVVVEVKRGYIVRRWWLQHWKWTVATALTATGVFAGLWALIVQ